MPVDFERLLAGLVGDAPPAGDGRARALLNLGSGRDRRPEFVNADRARLPEVDVVASLEPGPLPFADDMFSLVLCRDLLEHVDAAAALREVHRVTAPGGAVLISAVHFTSRDLFVDPTHVRGYSVRTFDFFAGALPAHRDRSYYFDFAFSGVEAAFIQFHTTLGRGRYLVWDRIVEPLVNRTRATQDLYEMTFLSRLFPAANVVVVLRK